MFWIGSFFTKRHSWRTPYLAAAVTLASLASASAAEEFAEVDITISGIETIEGVIGIAVFGSDDSYERRVDPVAQAFVEVAAKTVTWSATLSLPGRYAVIVYQDLNGNREIDLSRIGRPQEPYGFSNNPRIVVGPPDFDAARVELEPGRNALEIALR